MSDNMHYVNKVKNYFKEALHKHRQLESRRAVEQVNLHGKTPTLSLLQYTDGTHITHIKHIVKTSKTPCYSGLLLF